MRASNISTEHSLLLLFANKFCRVSLNPNYYLSSSNLGQYITFNTNYSANNRIFICNRYNDILQPVKNYNKYAFLRKNRANLRKHNYHDYHNLFPRSSKQGILSYQSKSVLGVELILFVVTYIFINGLRE